MSKRGAIQGATFSSLLESVSCVESLEIDYSDSRVNRLTKLRHAWMKTITLHLIGFHMLQGIRQNCG